MISREIALGWYPEAYADQQYGMGLRRKQWAIEVLNDVPRGTLYDVGCGRGEMIAWANGAGFDAWGCETVKALLGGRVEYGLAHSLPPRDNAYDVVTMFDVMEHLTEADCMDAIKELQRIAKKHIVLSISNRPSIVNGIDVHITKKPYDEWTRILRHYLPGTITHMRHPQDCVCEMWRVDL